MNEPELKLEGWHPDDETGGTRYWDGRRWTSARRPPRRVFAAKAHYKGWGIALTAIGLLYVVTQVGGIISMAFSSYSSIFGSLIGMMLVGIAFWAAIAAWGIYLLRGQGPTTKAVQAQLRQQYPVMPPAHGVAPLPAPGQGAPYMPGAGQPAGAPSAPGYGAGYAPAPAYQPAMTSFDCLSCGAPIQGPRGQVIKCVYCDSPQQMPA